MQIEASRGALSESALQLSAIQRMKSAPKVQEEPMDEPMPAVKKAVTDSPVDPVTPVIEAAAPAAAAPAATKPTFLSATSS